MTPSVLADLGYTYELDGDKQEAADAYTRAANAKPKEIGYQLSAAQAQLRVGNLEKARSLSEPRRSHQCQSLSAARHPRAAGQRREQVRPIAIAEYNAAINALPAGGVPEGQLYPIQLRLNLAELYRENGDEQAAHQQLADRRSRRSTSSMCRVRRRPSSCAFALR